MKLEEVLPAMREGRVGVWHGKRFVVNDKLRQYDGVALWNEASIVCSMLDDWTLEPEPKVEWPKGSLQWAVEQAGEHGSIRRKGWDGSMRVDGCMRAFTDESLSLDWEVVP